MTRVKSIRVVGPNGTLSTELVNQGPNYEKDLEKARKKVTKSVENWERAGLSGVSAQEDLA